MKLLLTNIDDNNSDSSNLANMEADRHFVFVQLSLQGYSIHIISYLLILSFISLFPFVIPPSSPVSSLAEYHKQVSSIILFIFKPGFRITLMHCNYLSFSDALFSLCHVLRGLPRLKNLPAGFGSDFFLGVGVGSDLF